MNYKKSIRFALPLLLFLFSACTPAPKTPVYTQPPTYTPQMGTTQIYTQSPEYIPTPEPTIRQTPKPRKQIQSYKKISENDIPKEIKPVRGLRGKNVFLHDAWGGYSDGMLVEKYLLFTEERSNQSAPILVVLDEEEEPTIYPTGFWKEFRSMSISPLLAGRKELVLLYGYGDKQAVEIFDPEKLQISGIYESDRVQILENGDIVETTLFNQDGTRRLVMNTYEIRGVKFLEKETPVDFKTAESMDFLLSRPTKSEIELLKNDMGSEVFDVAVDYLIKVDDRKTEIEPTIISDPSQAIKQLEDILRTDDPFIVGEAFRKASEDLYVADSQTGEAKPLWNYILEYKVKEGGVEVRGNVDAFLVYHGVKRGLELTPIGGIPLPWAEGEPLAIVVAREVTKDIAEKPGSTYITLRVREENGELTVEGDVEVGSRAIQLYKGFNAFVIVTKNGYEKYKPYLTEGRWGGGVQIILRDTEERKITRKQEERKKTEETINQLKEKLEEIKEKTSPEVQRIQKTISDLERKIYDIRDRLEK